MSNVSKGNSTELLYKKWLQTKGMKVHKAARAGFVRLGARSFCQSHDIFGCLDIIAITKDTTIGAQCTTNSGRSARRKKIEAVGEWPLSWTIQLVSHETKEDPTNKRKKVHLWKIETFNIPNGKWDEPIEIPFNPKELRGQ